MAKRKLKTPSSGVYNPKRKKTSASSSYKPGSARVSGYYGRFSGANPELKFHDIDVDDAVIATGGTIQNTGSINLIAQGTTESTRIGRNCVVKQISWRYRVSLPLGTAEANTSDTVRLILYQDLQANGAAATVANILEDADFQSYNNLANSKRFKILMDRVHVISAPVAGGNGTAIETGLGQLSGSFYKKCNIVLEFDSTAGAITEIKSNNLGVLFISSGGLAGVDSKVRLRFIG